MTTSIQTGSEWTAATTRPAARWVPVTTADGRTRMETVWAVPMVTVSQVASAA